MEYLDYINCLLAIEDKYHLLQERIDGFAFWVYHREELMEELLRRKNHYGLESGQSGTSIITKCKLRCKMILNALLHDKAALKNADLLVFNHERRVWNGTVYECIYTDEIVKLFPKTVVMERPPHQQSHYKPVNTSNLVYTDKIEIVTMLHLYCNQFILKSRYKKVQAQIRAKIKPACEELTHMMQVDFDCEEAVTMMTNGYFIYEQKKVLFAAQMKRYNPKVILEVMGDNIDCMIINELALAKKIPTIELQHGVTGREHIAYNYPEKSVIRQFPRYFFTFSEFWCNEARYPIPEKRRKAVGFPYLEREVRKYRDTKKGEKSIILFISQETIGKELSDIAIRLEQKIDKRQYQIIYKLHPGEYRDWRKRYPQLAESGIKVIDSSKTALYYLFSISTCQIGGFGSTATFEGMYFGLRTFIYEYRAVSFLKALCEQGYASLFGTVEELYGLILKSEDTPETASRFWQEDALSNMKKEIEKIMDGRE